MESSLSPMADSKLFSTNPCWTTQSAGRLSDSPQSSYAYAAAMRALHSKVRQLEEENASYRSELEVLKAQPISALRRRLAESEMEISSLRAALQAQEDAMQETEQLKAEVSSLRSTIKTLSTGKKKHHCSRCPKNQQPDNPDVECHLRRTSSLNRLRYSGSVKELVRASQEEAAKLAFSAGKLGVLSFKIDRGSRNRRQPPRPGSAQDLSVT